MLSGHRLILMVRETFCNDKEFAIECGNMTRTHHKWQCWQNDYNTTTNQATKRPRNTRFKDAVMTIAVIEFKFCERGYGIVQNKHLNVCYCPFAY
jgi:hypothetical protein